MIVNKKIEEFQKKKKMIQIREFDEIASLPG